MHQHEEQAPESAVATKRREAPASGRGAQVLALQQGAGNQAVAQRLAVQRHTPGPAEGPAQPIGQGQLQQVLHAGVAAASVGADRPQDHGAAPPVAEADATARASTEAPGPAAAAPTPAPEGGGGGGIFGAIGSFFSRAGSSIASGARAVGGAIASGARAVGGAIASGAKAIGGAISGVATSVRRALARARISIDVQLHGSPASCGAQARTYIDQVFMGSSLENLEAMAGKTIEFHIIPIGTKLTQLPPFTSLAGQTTFDGRLWDDVRGIWMGAGATTVRFAVGAEDLGAGGGSGYGPGFVAAHEGGHGLQNHGLTDSQKAAITKAYADKIAAHPVTQATPATDAAQAFWLQPEWYSAANQNEYFASSVAAWFGHPYAENALSRARYTRAWLKTNDKPMYDVLATIYGE